MSLAPLEPKHGRNPFECQPGFNPHVMLVDYKGRHVVNKESNWSQRASITKVTLFYVAHRYIAIGFNIKAMYVLFLSLLFYYFYFIIIITMFSDYCTLENNLPPLLCSQQ